LTARRPLLLIVDDDRCTAVLLGRLLHQDGYDTEVEPDGSAALERLEHEPIPDALITDYHVPGANGLVIAQRALASRSGIPIFIVTGDRESVLAALRARATVVEVMSKPLDYVTLVARLHAAVPVNV
jgi:CheY-like chemotaxis protein